MRWVASVALLLAGCETAAPCSLEALQRALDDAPPGSVVPFGACELRGQLVVPAEVELRGQVDRSRLISEDGAALTLAGEGARATGITIQSRGASAVRASAASSIEALRIEVERGVGILARASLAAAQVDVVGPISGADAADPVYRRVVPGIASAALAIGCGAATECTPGDQRSTPCTSAEHCAETQVCDACGLFATWTATHGVITTDGATLTLSDATVTGFAEHGVLVSGATARLERVSVDAILGSGIFATGSEVDLVDVDVLGTRSGLRGATSFGIAADGSTLRGSGLHVADTEGIGVIVASSRAELGAMVIERSDQVGVLAFDAPSLVIRGPDVQLLGNRGAGIHVAGGSLVDIADVHVAETRLLPFFVGGGIVQIGDGLLGTDVAAGSSLARATLDGSERAQLTLVAASAESVPMALVDVVVDGVGVQRGAVVGPLGAAGVTAIPDGPWSAGLVRRGQTAINDVTLASEALPIAPDAAPPSIASARDRLGVVMPIM